MSIMHYLIYVIPLFCLASVETATYFRGLRYLKKHLKLHDIDLSNIKENWIKQPLNHHDPHENRTLKVRYFENNYYWKPNGALYIFLGGEWEESAITVAIDDRSLLCQLAKATNGAIFSAEHRYYGKSLPNIPRDDKIKYFKYLSSEQALADFANLIKKIKSDPKFASSAVVVIGGSYSANLAVWMRVLYPDVVDAAIASSAPVLAKKDFHGYLDTVRYTFGKYGTKNCLQNIEKRFKKYENLLKSNAGIKTLKQELNICPKNDLTLLENKQCLFGILYNYLKGAAQDGPASSIKYHCTVYKTNGKLKLNKLLNTTKGQNNCIHVDSCGATDFDPNYEAWTYQYCTEFGYLQTTSSEKQPFVHWNPVNHCIKPCKGFVKGDIEKTIDEGVAKTNKLYGGLSPKVSKVVFAHGDMDPWHTLGVTKDLGPDAPAFVVNGTTHCGLLYDGGEEPDEMKEKRKYVIQLIKKWVIHK